MTVRRQVKFRFFALPVPHPQRRWWDWWRLAMVVVVVLGAIIVPPLAVPVLRCQSGIFPINTELWYQDGDCVGITDSADFNLNRFDTVMRRISQQNSVAGSNCDSDDTTMTMAAVVSLDSPNDGGRDLDELEGFAAAQVDANRSGCVHGAKLEIANMGSNEQAEDKVAHLLANDPDVIAVVGMGLSSQQSSAAATILGGGANPMLMVADHVTAEGFDVTGSHDDHPDFSRCTYSYAHGVGDGHFYRIAYRVAPQITKLLNYTGKLTKPDFVLTPDSVNDPYTCTAYPLVEAPFRTPTKPRPVDRLGFEPAESASDLETAVDTICASTTPVTVVYTARGADLGQFITKLGNKFENNGACVQPITVLSTSDASRLRAVDNDPKRNGQRTAALGAKIFTSGHLKLIYTPLADTDSTSPTTAFQDMSAQFRADDFPVHGAIGDWAATAYDAFTTVSDVTRHLTANQPVLRGDINAAMSRHLSFTGASGPIDFDASGNRTDRPVALRLCPGPSVYAVPAMDNCAKRPT
jgi:hypothetical protein